MKNNTMNASVYLSKYTVTIPSAIEHLAYQKTSTMLGTDYEPLDLDVVCGRGKGSYNRPGNRNFRSIVAHFIPEYIAAKTKIDKTTILNTIIERVRNQQDSTSGRNAQFIKRSKSVGWIEIGDEQAREKVGHAIREAMASQRQNTGKKGRSTKACKSPSNIEQKKSEQEHPSVEPQPMEEISSECKFSDVDLAILQAQLLPSATVGSRSSFTLVDDLLIGV